jgi:UDP-GlcNAc:undecaprenyl-phosphate GlcNAc-1-phosphate transferase
MLWVVGIMNSINMLDNMDSISANASLYITLTAFMTLVISNDLLNPYIPVLVGLIAALLGFLYYNWNPSKMIMGDTGSQFLGVMLSVIGILYFWNAPTPTHGDNPALRQVLLVVIVYIVLIIDTTTVIIKRIRSGKSPFVGGKDHTTHHLSYLGFSDRQVGLIFMTISMISSIIALIILHWTVWSGWLAASLILYFLTLFSTLFYIANLNKK